MAATVQKTVSLTMKYPIIPILRMAKPNLMARDSASVLSCGYITGWNNRTFTTGGTSSKLRCYEARQIDMSGGKTTFTFDTHAAVKQLESSGLPITQAEATVQLILNISQINLENMNKNLVSKPQQEILVQQIMSHISSVKKDMVILEKSEFSTLKHEYEKQQIELKNLQKQLSDETSKLKSTVTLDLNLERSRAKEAHAENEQKVRDLINTLAMQKSENDKKDTLLDNKIDKEIANLLTTYERYRNDMMKYAAGTVMTCLGLGLGFYRIWAK